MDYDKTLEQMGYPLDRIDCEPGLVENLTINGDIIYASGQIPMDGDILLGVGKVPSQISVSDARRFAELSAANVLRAVRKEIGSLSKIERVLRVTGYVNADPAYTEVHEVIHGASRLLLKVFGENGRHARTALGMAQLPLGVCVEIEMILKLKSAKG